MQKREKEKVIFGNLLLFKSRKSQASVISTVLLILIVLVAIVIIFNVVYGVIKDAGEEIEIPPMSIILGADIEEVKLDSSNVQAFVTIRRSPGRGNVTGVKLLFDLFIIFNFLISSKMGF